MVQERNWGCVGARNILEHDVHLLKGLTLRLGKEEPDPGHGHAKPYREEYV